MKRRNLWPKLLNSRSAVEDSSSIHDAGHYNYELLVLEGLPSACCALLRRWRGELRKSPVALDAVVFPHVLCKGRSASRARCLALASSTCIRGISLKLEF